MSYALWSVAMPERLEIDALRTLSAIARNGGVTRAANQLALSQSAVSHKIRRLEQRLGCDVLTRRAGGPLFTDAGQRLLEYARRIIDLHDEAVTSLGRIKLAGAIRMGMTEDTTCSGLARILGRFTRLYPEIQVRTRINQSLVLQQWLDTGGIDVAVMQVFERDARPDDLILYQDSLYWVKSRELTFTPDAPIPFVAFDENCFYKHWVDRECSAGGLRFDTVMECTSAAGLLSAVRSGIGVALLNGLHLTPDVDVIAGVLPPPPDIHYIVRGRADVQSAAVCALVKEIEREIGRAISVPAHKENR